MVVLSVSIHVKPEHTEAFISAMLANARASRTEPGNLRYDLLRDADDPTHFLLYEVYRDAEALDAHRNAPHLKTWAALTASWMAEPRTRVIGQPLFYGDEEVAAS